MGAWRHVRGFLAFPFMGIFLVPALLLLFGSGIDIGWGLDEPWNFLTVAVGLLLIGIGLYLVLAPTIMFARYGRGTVAHFDPPQKLVLSGVYRHVRNPLIVGVVITVLGEGILFGAPSLLYMAVILVPLNHVIIVMEEEPRLVDRFGDDYRAYMENVPRWLPRWSPWDPVEASKVGDGPGGKAT
ncbi:MAG: isoprenylcysteine carboxylmethyltransferase family protein [Thermoplasmata archaeon]|nr:MAG: isoprenylcysteine carboxylmethyltransferase family protein [Thermoplasmata archaeon]